jgi:hypothetical protein
VATHERREGGEGDVICYHTTDAADEILAHGFRDATGSYGYDAERTGIFLGDSPMGINEGAKGDQVLRVEFPDDVDLSEYEWVDEEHQYYRERHVPAKAIKERATDVRLMSDDELERMGATIWRGYLDPTPPGSSRTLTRATRRRRCAQNVPTRCPIEHIFTQENALTSAYSADVGVPPVGLEPTLGGF